MRMNGRNFQISLKWEECFFKYKDNKVNSSNACQLGKTTFKGTLS